MGISLGKAQDAYPIIFWTTSKSNTSFLYDIPFSLLVREETSITFAMVARREWGFLRFPHCFYI